MLDGQMLSAYTDPQMRFSLKPPEGWQVEVTDTESGTASLAAPDGGTFILILPEEVPEASDLRGLATRYEKLLRKTRPGMSVELLEEGRAEIGRQPALLRYYALEGTDDRRARVMATFVKRGSLSLTIAATVSDEKFAELRPVLQACFRTLRFHERKAKLVVVSRRGEVTNDTRYIGERVRYRIYYSNDTGQQTNVSILDRLDKNLSTVKVSDDGKYSEAAHTVNWEIGNVPANGDGCVELEATIGEAESIANKALIQMGQRLGLTTARRPVPDKGRGTIETNSATVTVRKPPRVGWMPFAGGTRSGEAPKSYMKDETTTGIMVNFDIPGIFVHEVKVDGIIYHRFSVPGHTTLLELGKPDLPIIGQVVEVPHGVNFTVEIFKEKTVSLRHYNVYPAQERQIRQDEPRSIEVAPGETRILDSVRRLERPLLERAAARKFALDKSTYLTSAYYPAEAAVIEAEDVGVIRGHRVAFLKVNPVQYNPVTREIRAFSKVEVRLKYDRPAQVQAIDGRIESPAFEDLLRASVLNYKEINRFDRLDTREDEQEKIGCDYLIITHGNFHNATDANNPVVRLEDWKRRKGYRTMVVNVASIPGGSTANNIRNYIQNAYDTWSPVPTYVLLVGDAEMIPTNYQTAHPSHDDTLTGTDIYYTTVDGSDYFPDTFIGRLPVDSLPETRNVVNKILDYERNAPANAAYYTDTSLVCLFEDDTDRVGDTCPEDGREDCTFRIIEFAEEIWDYLDTDYSPERVYDQSGNFAGGPQQYENGANLPANLTTAGGFPWNGGTADITNAINNGNFIITYNGHGNRSRWSQPRLGIANENGLANGPLTPIAFVFACQTG